MNGLIISRPIMKGCYAMSQESKETITTARFQATFWNRELCLCLDIIARTTRNLRCRSLHRSGRHTRSNGVVLRPASVRQQGRRNHAIRDRAKPGPGYDGYSRQRQGQHHPDGYGLNRNRRGLQGPQVRIEEAHVKCSAKSNQPLLGQKCSSTFMR